MNDFKDKATGQARKSGLWGYTATGIGVLMSFFQLYTAGYGSFPPMIQRSVHLAFGFFLAFMLYPFIKDRPGSKAIRALDLILGAAAVYSCIHIIITYNSLIDRMGLPTTMDIICGGVLLVLLLEMGRRTIGWPLPIIAIAALLYSSLGPYMPGLLAHRGKSVESIIAYMYTTTEGVFGLPMAISATVVFAFILFGTFLVKSGTGDFLTDSAYSLAGTSPGGPAKIAVLSSAFFGMISGSVVANVVSTGSFTIPLMKRIGFKPHFAGAVEATASTGGQIMPPIMGAAVFIMADIVGIPYVQILFAAAIPASLYFISLLLVIHFRAVKTGIGGLPRSELPKLSEVLKARGHLAFPPLVLVFILTVVRYSPMKTAFLTLPVLIVVAALRKTTRLSLRSYVDALKDAAFISVQIIAACGLAGIVMAVVTQTGLGLKFSNLLITLAHNSLFPTMLSIILGTGVTTSAAYIVASLMGATALEQFGVSPIAAHLFILYFAVISFITPPVAIGAYAAAGIAESNPFKTGFEATRIGLAGFIVPFMFVFGPSLLLIGSFCEIITTTVTAVIGILALAASLEGYLLRRCAIWERIVLFAVALLLMKPGLVTDAAGIGGMGLIYLLHWRWKKSQAIAMNKYPSQ
ncbi:MAG: TRAP transporter permease, partial [Deltaproteobacteria bacterium]|nr:TRAP transporter permease [Deltaproteobacteria bacterium]